MRSDARLYLSYRLVYYRQFLITVREIIKIFKLKKKNLLRKNVCTGAQSAGCRFNKRPQYRYSGCHAYDTSALNIILGLYFNFDDSFYVHQESETYFNKIQSDEVTEEYLMIARQNNATEANAKTLISIER